MGNLHLSTAMEGQLVKRYVKPEIHSFTGYSMFMRTDGIIQLEFDGGYEISLDDAHNQVRLFRELSRNRKCALLSIFRHDTSFGKEVREFISSPAVSDVIGADALVISGLALKILTNGYLKINTPCRPTRVFDSTPAALKWLHALERTF